MAVGVSGGGDSLVLAALIAAAYKKDARYLIVDHRLRPESTEEAKFAAANLGKLGIKSGKIHILSPPSPPEKRTQQVARDARFAAFEAYCRRAGIFDLLLAHHLEDQAETLLGRLSRGSGVQGLAAMQPLRYLPHFRLIRPLLTVSRKRLRATLAELSAAHGLEAADDPSNRAEKYLRTRLRRALAKEGGDVERLAATASHLGRAAAAINKRVAELGAECLKFLPRGNAELAQKPFAAAESEVALRLLEKILNRVGGGDLRFKSLFRIYGLLARSDGFLPQTLNHCKISYRPPLVVFARQE